MDRRYAMFSVLLIIFPLSSPHRILGLAHYNGRSMNLVFQSLMKALAARGHQVTSVSHFPLGNKIPNYTDVSIADSLFSLPTTRNGFSFEMVNFMKNIDNFMDFAFTHEIRKCQVILEHKNIKELIKSRQKYDLIITMIFTSDCLLGFAGVFDAPIISIVTNVAFSWVNNRLGNPGNTVYMPTYFLPFTPSMNFFERFSNTFKIFETNLRASYETESAVNELTHEHFGSSLPPLWELTKKTSLILVNSHFSSHQPRPTVPAFVEVGGIHIGALKPLPEEYETFLNESTHGVVFFSFGSLIRLETFPEEKLRALLDAFAELPQRVLMKSGPLPAVPRNVKVVQWVPQLEVLCHPKVLAFMTHSGLLGIQEAVYCGVPLVGTSFFGDQHQNINKCVEEGFAIKLDFDSITKDIVLDGLKTVIANFSYRENIRKKSIEFRDRPETPMDTAIFWTEYVIRHGDTSQIRSSAVTQTWYQHYLLDVIVVLLITIFCCSFVIYKLAKNTT